MHDNPPVSVNTTWFPLTEDTGKHPLILRIVNPPASLPDVLLVPNTHAGPDDHVGEPESVNVTEEPAAVHEVISNPVSFLLSKASERPSNVTQSFVFPQLDSEPPE